MRALNICCAGYCTLVEMAHKKSDSGGPWFYKGPPKYPSRHPTQYRAAEPRPTNLPVDQHTSLITDHPCAVAGLDEQEVSWLTDHLAAVVG